jgi:hypothetical protein
MESVTPEDRDKSLFQAKLLAGALWEASAVLIDQLFEDIAELRSLAEITRRTLRAASCSPGYHPSTPRNNVRFA